MCAGDKLRVRHRERERREAHADRRLGSPADTVPTPDATAKAARKRVVGPLSQETETDVTPKHLPASREIDFLCPCYSSLGELLRAR